MMVTTDRPRANYCAACVRMRSLGRDPRFARVAEDAEIRGRCDDCGVNDAVLEAWRRVDVPPPVSTRPCLSHPDLDEEDLPHE